MDRSPDYCWTNTERQIATQADLEWAIQDKGERVKLQTQKAPDGFEPGANVYFEKNLKCSFSHLL